MRRFVGVTGAVFTNEGAAALIGATFVQLGSIAAMLIERCRTTSAQLPTQ